MSTQVTKDNKQAFNRLSFQRMNVMIPLFKNNFLLFSLNQIRMSSLFRSQLLFSIIFIGGLF